LSAAFIRVGYPAPWRLKNATTSASSLMEFQSSDQASPATRAQIPIPFLRILGGLAANVRVCQFVEGGHIAAAFAAANFRLRLLNRHAHDICAFRHCALSETR
jgi:hypothetical protein